VDEKTSALGYRMGLAAKERKDRKKERDKNLLERWKFECEHWADNRDTSDLIP